MEFQILTKLGLENLKIESVEALLGRVGTRNQLLLKVVTECGLVGWGESGFSSREQAVIGAIEHFRPLLLGKDPRAIGRIWQELYRSHYFEGGRVVTAALSAIDIALYDLVGKHLEVPVYQLLGGKQRDKIPCFACSYQVADPDKFDAICNEITALIEMGWKAIRVIPCDFDTKDIYEAKDCIAKTARCLNKLREVVGPDITLGIDYHHRLTVAEAASFCQRLSPGTLDFIEEPIRNESPEAYEALRSLTSVPFAIGEEFSSKWQAMPYVERGITQYLRIDVCNIGGLGESLKAAAMAESHYIDVMPHNPLGPVCTAATVHLSAAIPNLSMAETHQGPFSRMGASDERIFLQQVTLEGCDYIVPDTPGLGVEIDEEAFKKSRPRQSEVPHLKRRDGAVTNW